MMMTKALMTRTSAQTRRCLLVVVSPTTSVFLQIRLPPPEATAALTGPRMRSTRTCEIPLRSGSGWLTPCSPSSSSVSTVACS